ncbi:hypothetical protein JCM2421_18910 [Staphylococcus auricularis]|nr:hypothetical protein JCM2421_18910 [Staphylococcus auricularis]
MIIVITMTTMNVMRHKIYFCIFIYTYTNLLPLTTYFSVIIMYERLKKLINISSWDSLEKNLYLIDLLNIKIEQIVIE